jgi:cobalamin biosynthetic protein CobC
MGNAAADPHFTRHGGRLAAARARFPGAPRPWIDLSTGINPYPARAPRGDPRRLPDPAEVAALESAAAAAFAALPDHVAAVAGAEAGLRLLPFATGARRAVIAGPTYGGHEAAWRAAGAALRVTEGADAALAEDAADAVILVNPNNPDGRLLPASVLRDHAARLAARGAWLVVDESFVETVPEASVAAQAGDRLVVLRSFGKFYGLPGLRLGFVLGAPALLARLRALTGDWPVGGDAVAAGRAAYADAAWARRTRRHLAGAAAWLDGRLAAAGFEIVGGTALFRLAAAADAARRFERLAEAGILVRPFAQQPTWLRFGVPHRRDRARVQQALQECAG